MIWQPIETAPKDGTRVLVCGKDGINIARWNGSIWIVADCEGYGYDLKLIHANTPCHWMPLPKSCGRQSL